MDGPVFDAMLKNALEEALRQDIEEIPASPPPSRRQRKRMRRLLAEPRRAWAPEMETGRRFRNPARYLAAVVIAALLTGAAAAGLALGGGERFRQMFEKDTWAADYYKNAADTEQLLDLGAGMNTTLLESDGLRFEMLDAVSDGQTAMLELRVTVLDPDLLERLKESDDTAFFMRTEVCSEDGEDLGSIGFSSRSWKSEEALEEGQYSLLCSFCGESLSLGGRYDLRLADFTLFPQETGQGDVLREGPWTLSVTLRPKEVLRLEPNVVCRVKGIDWILDGVTLSPLALGLTFHREDDGGRYSDWFGWAYKGLSIRLKNGEELELKGTTSVGSSNTQMNMQIEFLMPLDLEQVEALRVYDMDIPLHE
ncbi:hypothetical protein [Oscillibacter sp.]|uniref:hypothetical protein n=1 Tax=Oscillibacter sp. TaxID=1945593 RepID=UPI002D7E6197|nr:hypothetical protein [Oscillibacter sp.]